MKHAIFNVLVMTLAAPFYMVADLIRGRKRM